MNDVDRIRSWIDSEIVDPGIIDPDLIESIENVLTSLEQADEVAKLVEAAKDATVKYRVSR